MYPLVRKNEIETYVVVYEEESCILRVTHVSECFESQYQKDKNGKPKIVMGVGLNLIIGSYYERYIVSEFIKSQEGIDRRILWGFIFRNGAYRKAEGFRPVASTFLDVNKYQDLPRPGDEVSVNIRWRPSHSRPNEPNRDFPNDKTKNGMILDVVPNSLRVIPRRYSEIKTIQFPEDGATTPEEILKDVKLPLFES